LIRDTRPIRDAESDYPDPSSHFRIAEHQKDLLGIGNPACAAARDFIPIAATPLRVAAAVTS
jgi:hypothetical protein